jgi:hypothetical protein
MRTLTALGCLLSSFLCLAGPAGAMVQLDRGIAGARLGASRAAVKAALGTPTSTKSGTNDFGAYVQYRFAGGLTVVFQGKSKVTSVSTTGLGDRTTQGVGVGSTQAEADALPGVKCENGSCHTGSFVPGRRVTDFLISGGKVTRVTVALVVD